MRVTSFKGLVYWPCQPQIEISEIATRVLRQSSCWSNRTISYTAPKQISVPTPIPPLTYQHCLRLLYSYWSNRRWCSSCVRHVTWKRRNCLEKERRYPGEEEEISWRRRGDFLEKKRGLYRELDYHHPRYSFWVKTLWNSETNFLPRAIPSSSPGNPCPIVVLRTFHDLLNVVGC